MSGPVKTIRDKGLQIAVWESNNGGYSFSISKTYKCKATDQWKDSKYFYKEDLQKLGDMIQLAVGYASDRATHEAEAIASPKQEPKFTPFEDDDLPF
jgi:transposase